MIRITIDNVEKNKIIKTHLVIEHHCSHTRVLVLMLRQAKVGVLHLLNFFQLIILSPFLIRMIFFIKKLSNYLAKSAAERYSVPKFSTKKLIFKYLIFFYKNWFFNIFFSGKPGSRTYWHCKVSYHFDLINSFLGFKIFFDSI